MPTKFTQAKPSKFVSTQPKIIKACAKCGKQKQLKDFAQNKKWKQQHGHDKWCKDCVSKLKTKESVRQYFWQNNRVFTQDIWGKAVAKATSALISNPLFNDSSESRQNAMIEQIAAGQILSLLVGVEYEEHKESYEQAKASGKLEQKSDPNQKEWSPQFQGYFTDRQLQYLNDYYKKLSDDMNFDTESTRDYAQKVCKASLIANKAMDDFRAGKCDLSSVKDALNTFDMLSKSANFAACKRKPGEQTGINSWSQTTLYLETHGKLRTDENKWQPDDKDEIIALYQHIVSALGLDDNL